MNRLYEHSRFRIAGATQHMQDLVTALDGTQAGLQCLVNADDEPDAQTVIARCQDFTASLPAGQEALVVTLLRAAPQGLATLASHAVAASVWAFTLAAALDWAPRRIRVNAIGLGPGSVPFARSGQAGCTASTRHAVEASMDDVARTLRLMAGLPSMTGQFIRLGG